jgi:hypothetical protein
MQSQDPDFIISPIMLEITTAVDAGNVQALRAIVESTEPEKIDAVNQALREQFPKKADDIISLLRGTTFYRSSFLMLKKAYLNSQAPFLVRVVLDHIGFHNDQDIGFLGLPARDIDTLRRISPEAQEVFGALRELGVEDLSNAHFITIEDGLLLIEDDTGNTLDLIDLEGDLPEVLRDAHFITIEDGLLLIEDDTGNTLYLIDIFVQ